MPEEEEQEAVGATNDNEWIAYEDDDGRGTYYYNAATGESSWEVPNDAIIVKPPSMEEGEAVDQDGRYEGEGDGTGDGNVEEGVGDGGVTMKEFNEESINANEPTKEIDKEDVKSEDETRRDEQQEEELEQTSASSTALPPGWIELMDENSGVPYYYHEETNATTWDRPYYYFDEDQRHQQQEDISEDKKDTNHHEEMYSISPRHDVLQSPPRSRSPYSPQIDDGTQLDTQEEEQQQHQLDSKKSQIDEIEGTQEIKEDMDKKEDNVESKEEVEEVKTNIELATEALAKPDAILEPKAAEHVLTLVTENQKKGAEIAMKNLVSTYGSMTATCGLLTKWLVDISVKSSSDSKSTTTSSTNTNTKNSIKKRHQAAEPIRSLIESVITKTAKDHYTKEAQQNILNLKAASDRNFLLEMMDNSPWRKLLIDLSATFPNSPLLTYCLKEISKRGYHREIAKRIENQSDYFDVFHGLLVSELSRLGNTAVNGNIFHVDNSNIVREQNGDEEEWNFDLETLVEDMKRSCTSTAYTYIYTLEMLNELIKRASAKVEVLSGPRSLVLSRAIKKWNRIAEQLESHMMKTSTSQSQSFSALAKKRRMDVALTVSNIQQAKRRRMISTTDANMIVGKVCYNLDSALIALMKRHAMGVTIDETILDQLLRPILKKDGNNSRAYLHVGSSLIQHPSAIDTLLQALFIPIGRIKSSNIKTKCARLVAIAVLVAEKELLKLFDEEETGKDFPKEVLHQGLDHVEHTANMIIKGSQLCEEAENVVKFVVSEQPAEFSSSLSGSVGSQLSLLCIKCAPVAEGCLLWAQEKCKGNEFPESAAYPTLAPGILSLARIIAKNHPFSREAVVDLAVLFLCHSSSELSPQKMNEIKQQALRLLLILLTQGLAVHVLRIISQQIKNKQIDSNLIRYFIAGALDIISPPVSVPFVHVFGRLLQMKTCVDAVKSDFFKLDKQNDLKELISSFRSLGTDPKFTGADKTLIELVSSLHTIYQIPERRQIKIKI